MGLRLDLKTGPIAKPRFGEIGFDEPSMSVKRKTSTSTLPSRYYR
jgi:hypothetical protein